MASRQAFTDEEWKVVLGGVFMVGFAVTASQPSGFLGMLREGVASRRALAEASKSATANTLIKTVASALRSRSGRKITNTFTGENLRGAKQEELKTRAIAAVRQAMVCVERRAPGDAHDFREWLLQIAARVAGASKEGSFFGLGGTTVGDVETRTLSELAEALRVSN